jgi:hypothetical protein
MRKIILVGLLLSAVYPAISQIRVFYSETEDKIFYYEGGPYTDRSYNAYKRCAEAAKGCSEVTPTTELSGLDKSYGCWCIMTGKTKDGKKVVAYANLRGSVEEAKNDASFRLINFEYALPNTVTEYASNCLKKPEPPKASAFSSASKEWSDWKKAPCYQGLLYRVRQFEVFDLNEQYHYYFEVKNTYSKEVSFLFNLLDANEKIRFGDRHDVRSGGTVSFNHKMSSNYIAAFQVQGLKAGYSNEELPCDDQNAATEEVGGKSKVPLNAKEWQTDATQIALIMFSYNNALKTIESAEKNNKLASLKSQLSKEQQKFWNKYSGYPELNNQIVNEYIELQMRKMGANSISDNYKPQAPVIPDQSVSAKKTATITMTSSMEEDLIALCDFYCRLASYKNKKETPELKREYISIIEKFTPSLQIVQTKYKEGQTQKNLENRFKAEMAQRGCEIVRL